MVGYWINAPKNSSVSSALVASPVTTVQPRDSARVCTTAMVCGWQSEATKNFVRLPLTAPCDSAIASAAEVASSSREAFAMGRPVRSITIVWKFSSASSRPCAISAWYGV